VSDLFDEATFLARPEVGIGALGPAVQVVRVEVARELAKFEAERAAAWARREPPPDAPDLHMRRVSRDAWEAIRCPSTERVTLLEAVVKEAQGHVRTLLDNPVAVGALGARAWLEELPRRLGEDAGGDSDG
jgi:hypothetical protein